MVGPDQVQPHPLAKLWLDPHAVLEDPLCQQGKVVPTQPSAGEVVRRIEEGELAPTAQETWREGGRGVGGSLADSRYVQVEMPLVKSWSMDACNIA